MYSEKRGGGGAAASASASAPTVAIDQPAASHRHVHGQRDMWVWRLPHRQSGAGRAGRQAVLCPLPRGSQPVPHPENGEARTAPRRPSRGGFSCGRMRWASIRSSVHPAKSGSRCGCCCSSNFLLLFGAPHRKSTCKYVDESPYYFSFVTRARLYYRSGDSVRSYSYALSHAVAYVSVHVRAMHSGGCLPF